MEKPKIYISYKNGSLSRTFGKALSDKFLENEYPSYFFDASGLFGGQWRQQMEQSLRGSDVLVVLIEANTWESTWVPREVYMARGLNISILPLLLEAPSTAAESVYRMGIEDIQYMVLSGDLEADFERIVEQIHPLRALTLANRQHWFGQFEEAVRREIVKGSEVIPARPVFGAPSDKSQFMCDVFMIMPFLDQFTEIYTAHIKPVVENQGLSIKRGDDFFSPDAIMREIWSAMYAAKLIIAECTGRNPNVYYELGIAHTLGKPVIMLTQDVDDIPFDLRHLRHIQYETTPEKRLLLEDHLTSNLIRVLHDLEES